MRKIFIIAKREYLERVRAKSFVVMTFAIPALMFAATVGPTLMMTRGSNETKHLVVVASDARTADLLRDQLVKLPEEQKRKVAEAQTMEKRQIPSIGDLVVDTQTDSSDATIKTLKKKIEQKELDGVILATQDAIAAKKITFLTRDVSSFVANSEIEGAVSEALRRDLLKSRGLTEQEINKTLQPVELEAKSPTGVGNPQALFFTVFGMAMVLYMTVLLYGINVMRAILEEKNSRIMEVMLSTARSQELMAGKILGVAAVGLTQIGIWAIMVLLPSTAGIVAGWGIIKNVLSPGLLAYFALFFLLGFSLYSTLCAAVGAMVNSEQEAQQLQFMVMMPMIAAVFIMVNIIQYPAGSLALWASLFPLTAPLIMFLRIALQSPPWWQIVISIGLMIATIYGLVWVCGRIYRVGILMYGKRPSLPEIMKWIRYA